MRHLAVNWQRRETADGGVRTDKTEVFVEKEDAGRGEATEERKKASGTEPSRQEERSRTPGGEQEETKHRRNRLLDETKVIEASEDAKTISGPGPPLSAPHAVGDGACVGLSPWPPAPSQSSSPAVAFLHTSLQAPSSPSAASPPTPSFSLPSTPSCSCPSPSLSSSGAASSQHPRMLLVSATASRLRTDRVRDLLRLPPDTRVELLRSIALWQDSDQAPLGRPSFAPVLPSSASSSFESLEASEERVRGETQAGASGMPRRGPGGLSDRENLIHLYVEATNDDILRNFQKFLKAEPFEKTLLVFCNKQKTAAWLQRWFAETEPEVESFLLDGWLDKTKRRSLLRRLLAGPSGPSRGSAEGDTGATGSGNDPRDALAGTRSAWITTEMAARGLDFAGVSVVVNFQLPADSTHYLHRAGRAGRAGNPGAVISFCRPGEASIVRRFARELNVAIHPTRIFHGRLWTLASKNERAPRQIGAVAPAAEG
uniref:ATP-dependent RNA helicase, putative n=1 Tax=Neospora caninum (strain Liverpool) TaxID=572307 RepID=F0JAX5_NEOCL|nr:ATP-dependent RNA helicase, putative [Neospora caninum Liverpool]CEL71241.1 TPA: ATP-dependent RNA helicase, putative [Neospora caninum Liverpool]